MGCKYALLSNRLDLGFQEMVIHRLKTSAMFQKCKRDECRVAFVHVENARPAVAEGAKHCNAAIQMVCQYPVAGIVLRKIGIQEQHWHAMAVKSLEKILPRAHPYLAAFDGYGYSG